MAVPLCLSFGVDKLGKPKACSHRYDKSTSPSELEHPVRFRIESLQVLALADALEKATKNRVLALEAKVSKLLESSLCRNTRITFKQMK